MFCACELRPRVMLTKISDAAERCDAHYHQSHATKIERRGEVCEELRGARLTSPIFAWSEAPRRVVVWEDVAPRRQEVAEVEWVVLLLSPFDTPLVAAPALVSGICNM